MLKYLRHPEKVAPKIPKRAFRIGWFLWTLAVIAGTHWPSLRLPQPPESSIWDLFPIDKIGHACGFAGLVIWTYLAWFTKPKTSPPLGYIKTVAILIPCALFAVVSEHTQQLVGGRSFDHADILANLTGVLSGFLIIAPRPRKSRLTTIAAWVARLGVIGLCFPLYQLWGTAAGGADAMKAYDLLGFHGDRPDHEAHTWLAFTLTLTISVARPLGIKRPRASAALTILGMAFLGPFMEIVQLNAGRQGMDLSDIAAHEKGLLFGLAAWTGLLTLRWAIALYGSLWRGDTLADVSSTPRAAETTTNQPASDRGFVGHAAVVSALTLLSRLTGLLRDAALAAVFGLGWVADAFFVAFLIPNLFRRLFGEGALTAAFIPRYTKLRDSDPELARRFATCCVSGLGVLLITLTLIGEAVFLALLTGADTQRSSTTLRLALIMLPYMPIICGVAFLGAVLQVHGRFGPAAGAPVLLNLVLVAAAAFTGPWTLDNNQSFADPERITAAVTIAWAILAAGALQLAWQVAALLKTTRPAFSTQGVWAPLKQMLTTMLPMLVGLGIFQINALLDSLIAYFGSPPPPEGASSGGQAVLTGAFGLDGLTYPLQTGDVAALQWAQRLYQFPLGVFGIAIATAIFPALARAAKDKTDFGKITRQGLRLTVFIGLPSTVGMVLVALPLTRAVYERAAFSLTDAQHVSTILVGYAAAVWAYSMTHTLTRAFYALDDAKTPLRVSLVMVAINLSLNLTLIWPFGAAGLAWSSAVCAAAQAGTLVWLLGRKPQIDRVVDDSVLNGWLRTLGLTAIMALVLAPAVRFLDVPSLSAWQNAGVLGGATLMGAIIFFGGAWLTKADELAWLRKS